MDTKVRYVLIAYVTKQEIIYCITISETAQAVCANLGN